MLLKDAGPLLGANERYFTVVYEAFKYKGEDLLRNYIDFIVREPVEWIRGFPLKLRTRPSFAKPKAAVIKLLKTAEVLEVLGTEYCSSAHDIVWDSFKKHGDDILNARLSTGIGGAAEENELITEEDAVPDASATAIDGVEEVTDISGAAAPIVSPWERKFYLLKSVVISMLSDYRDTPGIATALHTLIETLDGVSSS